MMSCVERISVKPVPNWPTPPVAIAAMRKLVSESFSGTFTVAVPSARERHAALPEQQRVEQLARALPAAAAALRWVAVAVAAARLAEVAEPDPSWNASAAMITMATTRTPAVETAQRQP